VHLRGGVGGAGRGFSTSTSTTERMEMNRGTKMPTYTIQYLFTAICLFFNRTGFFALSFTNNWQVWQSWTLVPLTPSAFTCCSVLL
jgi:hypothetical protein